MARDNPCATKRSFSRCNCAPLVIQKCAQAWAKPKTVNDIVKAKGFDVVFDKSGLSAGAVPVVLYSRDDLDFSAEVTAALNKNAPAKAGK